MIRIIGENPAALRECTCRNCGARLEYTRADTRERVVTDYTGDREAVLVITCPRCNTDIRVTP